MSSFYFQSTPIMAEDSDYKQFLALAANQSMQLHPNFFPIDQTIEHTQLLDYPPTDEDNLSDFHTAMMGQERADITPVSNYLTFNFEDAINIPDMPTDPAQGLAEVNAEIGEYLSSFEEEMKAMMWPEEPFKMFDEDVMASNNFDQTAFSPIAQLPPCMTANSQVTQEIHQIMHADIAHHMNTTNNEDATGKNKATKTPRTPKKRNSPKRKRDHVGNMSDENIMDYDPDLVTQDVILRMAEHYSNTEIFERLNRALLARGREPIKSVNVITRRITLAINQQAQRYRLDKEALRVSLTKARQENGVTRRMKAYSKAVKQANRAAKQLIGSV